ncbi:hypothetical protein E2C01_011025 [Portunus trituberculatus]|uniref:Uncharacterized protein n=1 Tax=Portunus trituberculatus TaxID=210409 RepID=A0A5B7DA04_PORTR|nr:hypothetical protein [Portunus trituberculatus]
MIQHICFTYFLHVCGFVSRGVCRKNVVLLAADDPHGQLADHQSLVTCGWDGRGRLPTILVKEGYGWEVLLYLKWLVELVESVGLYGRVHASGCLKSDVIWHDQLSLSILVQLLQIWSSSYASLNYLHLWRKLKRKKNITCDPRVNTQKKFTSRADWEKRLLNLLIHSGMNEVGSY